MKETPLLFSQEMMTAIRAGRKTQTRRTMREPWKIRLPKPVHGDWPFDKIHAPAGIYEAHHNPQGAVSVKATNGKMLGIKHDEFEWVTPYGGPGDLIWCKEKWRVVGWDFDDGTPHSVAAAPVHAYAANGAYKPVCTVSDGYQTGTGTTPVTVATPYGHWDGTAAASKWKDGP